MIVAIIGPDGSGKTTVAEAVVAMLSADGFVAVHYPQNFGILPKLSIFRQRTRAAIRKSSSQFDLKPNNPIASLIYVLWYGLDYCLGGLSLSAKNMRGGGRHVAVFARYYYDYYYQSNNRRLSKVIKKAIEVFFVPRPACVIFLDRDPAEIYAAKPELPLEEIGLQQREILEQLGAYRQFFRVDASGGLEETIDRAIEIVRFIAAARKKGRGRAQDS